MSKPQEDIALSPQASEYFGLSDPCQSLLWHRQLLFDLGFPQERIIVYEDNMLLTLLVNQDICSVCKTSFC